MGKRESIFGSKCKTFTCTWPFSLSAFARLQYAENIANILL